VWGVRSGYVTWVIPGRKGPTVLTNHRAALAVAAATGLAVLLPAAPGLGALPAAQVAFEVPPATPQGPCGPGSVPEPGLQGRVPADDVAAGGAADGYRCNVEVVGRFGISGGYKVERYVDAAGHECAFYDTTLLYPTNATAPVEDEPTGVAVLDMADPSAPRLTTTLTTPAMSTPHESLLVNAKRGLLAAVAGNPLFGPGQVDVYDVSQDCRNPVLKSSLPVGILGHESGFAPDGNTFWAASLGGGILTAIDVSNPSTPRTVYTGRHDTHALTISDDGNRAYLAAGAGFPRNEVGLGGQVNGLEILDVSAIQSRAAVPTTSVVGSVEWPTVTIPQAALPVTIGGKPYLVEVDEFASNGNWIAANGEKVGAGRIIDISDERNPRVVSDLRLEVHDPAVRESLAGDPGASSATGGYAGHYCAVPQREEPGIVACSFLASGLRVFDIRDPLAPKEVAYFVAPVEAGGPANAAFSSASFVPERREIWYSDGSRGFFALRLTNGAWPTAGRPAAPPQSGTGTGTGSSGSGSGPGGGSAEPVAAGRTLPATGLMVPLGAAVVLLLAALSLWRRPSKS